MRDSLFPYHKCKYVTQLGWSGIKNGTLLTIAEQAGFKVLVTFDKGIPSQQNMMGRRISILILKPEGQRLKAVEAMSALIESALGSMAEAEVKVISNRKSTR